MRGKGEDSGRGETGMVAANRKGGMWQRGEGVVAADGRGERGWKW